MAATAIAGGVAMNLPTTTHLRRHLLRFLADRRGSNAVEYALLAAMVAITAITGIVAFADSSVTMWTDLGTTIRDALD